MPSEVIEGHIRSFFFLNHLLFYLFFGLKSNLIKTLHECQHYEDTILDKMKYALKGLSRSYTATFMLDSL